MSQTVEEVKRELEIIAKEMGLQLENPEVTLEFCRRGKHYTKEVYEKLIVPLYFNANNPECYAIKVDENGKTIAYQLEKDGKWEYL